MVFHWALFLIFIGRLTIRPLFKFLLINYYFIFCLLSLGEKKCERIILWLYQEKIKRNIKSKVYFWHECRHSHSDTLYRGIPSNFQSPSRYLQASICPEQRLQIRRSQHLTRDRVLPGTLAENSWHMFTSTLQTVIAPPPVQT
jgi:hypothetical protein